MIVRKTVTPEGTVPGLEGMAGEEVLVVRARTERVAKALEKPLAVLDDVRRFVREHRDLTRRQLQEFTARYGNPADRAREYAKGLNLNVNADDVKARVREVNDFVERRLETIAKEVEKRYEDLEREVETAIERVFSAAPPAAGEATTAADAAPAADDAAAKKPKRNARAGGKTGSS